MAGKKKYKMTIDWEFNDTDNYPNCEAAATVKVKALDGQIFSTTMKQKGNDKVDAVRTLCRVKNFQDLIKMLTITAVDDSYLNVK